MSTHVSTCIHQIHLSLDLLDLEWSSYGSNFTHGNSGYTSGYGSCSVTRSGRTVIVNSSTSSNCETLCGTTNTIDLTHYNNLYLRYDISGSGSNGRYCIQPTKTATSDNTTIWYETEQNIDVSSLSGSYYIMFNCYSAHGGTTKIELYEAILS